MRAVMVLLTGVALLPAAVRAQQPADSLSLAGRSTIFVGAGISGSTRASTGNGVSSTSAIELGGVGFSHWIAPQVGVEISAGILSAVDRTTVHESYTEAITPILFGLDVAPRALAIGQSFRPFVGAAVGSYVHSGSDANFTGQSDFTESAFGARLSAGANWFAARHVQLGITGEYHAVGHFDHPDELTANASRFGLLLTAGFVWGGR